MRRAAIRASCSAHILVSVVLSVGTAFAQDNPKEPAAPGRKEVMSDVRTVAVAYIRAVGDKDFDQVKDLLHPEVEFTMAGKRIQGAQAYVATLQRLAPILVRNHIRQTVAEGKNVFVLYDFVTDTAVGPVPSVESLTIEKGRIRSIELVFHSQPWPTVLEELARRGASAH